MDDPKSPCVVCHKSDDEPFKFGELMSFEDKFVHYFCVLFSNTIKQRGEDTEGIYGFLEVDIRNDINLNLKTKCIYCKLFTANIECASKVCTKKFHVPCALKEKGLLQPLEPDFCIFCPVHGKNKLVQIEKKYDPIIKDNYKKYAKEICETTKSLDPIKQEQKINENVKHITECLRKITGSITCCLCEYQITKKIDMVRLPCCWHYYGTDSRYRNCLMHKDCLAKIAYNSGYKFKCPLCATTDSIFIDYVKSIGIFIPKRHATWEDSSVENISLLGVAVNCAAPICYCREGGRSFNNPSDEDSKFKMLVCTMCGAAAMHRYCLDRFQDRLEPARKYICYGCEMAINETTTGVVRVIDSDDNEDDSDLSLDGLLDQLSAPKLVVPKPIPPPPKKYYE